MVSLKSLGRAKGTHHFMANWVSGGVKYRPKAGEGVTRNQELACEEDIESSRAWSVTAGGIEIVCPQVSVNSSHIKMITFTVFNKKGHVVSYLLA